MNPLKIFNVDVFRTIRVAVRSISAESPSEAARIANELDVSHAIAITGKPAMRDLGPGSESYPVLEADVQPEDSLYYGVYPLNHTPDDDCDPDGYALDWNRRPSHDTKGPASKERDLLIKLMGVIDPVTLKVDDKHLRLLTDVARVTQDPCPVFREDVRQIEVIGYPRFDCPEDLSYEQWVNQKLSLRHRGLEVVMDDSNHEVPF